MNNKPKYYDTRWRHLGKHLSENSVLEDIYHCPKCNNLVWKTEIIEQKKCPYCNLIFDISDINKRLEKNK